MYQSEKNFLERIADAIPGLKGYRQKESRRDTDKRLREHIGSELDGARRGLDAWKRELLPAGKLDLLDDVDRVARKLGKAADQVRFASYGYAGFFDQVKVQEAELDKIYQYDNELFAAVRALVEPLAAGAPPAGGDPAKAIADLERQVDALGVQIEGRKQIFSSPE